MHDPLLPEVPLEGPPELTNCDREPIHTPEAIQTHGCLVGVRLQDATIVAAGENAPLFLGIGLEQLLGRPLSEVLPASCLEAFSLILDRGEGDRTEPRSVQVPAGSRLITAHHCDGHAILEFETPHENPPKSSDLVGGLFIDIQNKPIQDAYQAVVDQVRRFTRFDRVMLYQFLEGGHGSVIAESKVEHQEAFLGLHYPATDIPVPARRLYELNWIRTISDVSSDGVRLRWAAGEYPGRPLNLSFASLRAISPIHLEYLRNMGVGASMSISVMDGDRLWGLIACHHYAPKVISPEVRDACELCGSLLSAYLTSRRQQEYLRRQVEIADAIGQQLTVMTNYDDMAEGLERSAASLCSLLGAKGLVWFSQQPRFRWGEVPAETSLEQISQMLLERTDEPVLYTDQLPQWLPGWEKREHLLGMLAIRVGRREGGTLLFFRPPYNEEIIWAGNPDKSIVDESGRLTPRKSFAAWKEQTQGRSKPWSASDRETARSLAIGLQRMVAEQSERLRRSNDELRQLNADLDAFAYAASHDLKEPLRGIYHYVYLLEKAGALADEKFSHSLTGLKRIVKRMSDLLDGLLRFSRAGRADLHIERFSLDEVVDQAKDLLFAGQQPLDVHVELGQTGTITGDFACVREIIGNLLSNAIKYNTRSPKRIQIDLVPVAHTPLAGKEEIGRSAIAVQDNGIGIPEEYHQQIFDVFRRLHDHDAYGGGSGAGLTIVRRMVERHGGVVALKSDDQGTTFYFTLGETR